MRIVAISDTHEMHRKILVPDGDVLVHAGDMTWHGELDAIAEFNAWLGRLPHTHKIVIAGNHDWGFQLQPAAARALITNAIYLEDSSTEIQGVRFYGSPWQPEFCQWAFNLPRGPQLAAKWALIPENTDVLITHSPPYGIRDLNAGNQGQGCRDLLARVIIVKPRLHIFGHIHESYGRLETQETVFINAAACDERYRPHNPPVVWDLV